MRKRANQFPDELKLRIVKQYLQTELSVRDLKRTYGIRGNSCIHNWIRKFGLSYPSEDQINLNIQVAKERKIPQQESDLERKVRLLEKELEHEKLRTKALNTMIDIAEQEYKIPIRKKSGAKQ